MGDSRFPNEPRLLYGETHATGVPRLAGTPDLSIWEHAYLRFETPEQEVRKFEQRLRFLGAVQWKPNSEIVELFCGRGNGLVALSRLGFSRLEGVDLSPNLAARYRGAAQVHIADCRCLPFGDATKDVLIVQGGLHHLPTLPSDLECVLEEARRVLRNAGRFVMVEPWLSPFLQGVHLISRNVLARRAHPKMNHFFRMMQNESATYHRWLSQPRAILEVLANTFSVEHCAQSGGKLLFVGRKGTDWR